MKGGEAALQRSDQSPGKPWLRFSPSTTTSSSRGIREDQKSERAKGECGGLASRQRTEVAEEHHTPLGSTAPAISGCGTEELQTTTCANSLGANQKERTTNVHFFGEKLERGGWVLGDESFITRAHKSFATFTKMAIGAGSTRACICVHASACHACFFVA